MFKNNVFKMDVDTKEWMKCASIRAVKTMAQTMASMITVGQALSEIDWSYILSVSVTAGIYSIVMSIGGIPEVKGSEV